MEATSKVLKSGNPRSNSLRVTLPKEVINALDLTSQDEINWTIEAVDNELKVVVNKIKE